MKTTRRIIHLAALLMTLLPTVCSATTYYVATTGDDTLAGTNWANAKQTIQAAVDLTVGGDTVIVSNGVYATGSRTVNGAALPNRVAITKAITVESLNGRTNTIIEGSGVIGPSAVRCAYVGTNAVLSGFTLTNGATRATAASGAYFQEMGAGGVYCETGAVVTNCTIIRNSADTAGGAYQGTLNNCRLSLNYAERWGGGARASTLNTCILSNNTAELQGGGVWEGTLNDCTLTGNQAGDEGGGAISAELNDCTLTGNSAGSNGGGANGCTMNHCTLSGNTAGYPGGGAFGGTLNYCTLSGNSAPYGGGASGSALNTCLVFNNSAEYQGGGSYRGTLNNCTVTGNDVFNGSGGGSCEDSLNNCIVYFNNAFDDSYPNHQDSIIEYSCTTPLPGGGTSNITNAPLFVAASDFHLQPSSPCINAGDNTVVVGSTDRDGNPRIVDGVVDMGAYEYQSIIIATDPPVLTALTQVGNGTFQFGFTNLTGASFTVLGSTNVALPLAAWSDLGPALETPPGSGQFQFIDPQATNSPRCYYRVRSP